VDGALLSEERGVCRRQWLSVRDLADLDAAVDDRQSWARTRDGFYPRVFPVNGEMTLAVGFPWNNR